MTEPVRGLFLYNFQKCKFQKILEENCGEMWHDGKWNDQDCNEYHPYVCKTLMKYVIKYIFCENF